MRDMFGLPATPGYDNTYGLPIAAPVLDPIPAQQPLPRTPAPMDGVGGGLLAGNVLSFPIPGVQPPQNPSIQPPYAPTGQSNAPIVGRDITLKQLTDLQRKAESTGNYHAVNNKSSASGAYQVIDSTWNNYGGYPRALLAPPAVQDRWFAENLQKRIVKYNGDLFKAIADHYLPAQANDPSKWRTPTVFGSGKKKRVIEPVANYVRYVLKGTPYEKQLDDYLNAH